MTDLGWLTPEKKKKYPLFAELNLWFIDMEFPMLATSEIRSNPSGSKIRPRHQGLDTSGRRDLRTPAWMDGL